MSILAAILTIVAACTVVLAVFIVAAVVQIVRERRAPRPVFVTGDTRFLSPERAVVLMWRTRPASMTPEQYTSTMVELRRLAPTLTDALDRLEQEQARTVDRVHPVPRRTLPEPGAIVAAPSSTPAGGSLRARAVAQAANQRRCETSGHLWRTEASTRVRTCMRCGSMDAVA